MRWMPGTVEQTRATVRLFVWTIRGLAMSRVLSRGSEETEQAVKLFQKMVRAFARSSGSADPSDLGR